MGVTKLAAEIFRRYVTDGVPASGVNSPNKVDISAWGTWLETMLSTGIAGLAYSNLANANADLAHGANSTAIVYNDATAANNGLYQKLGVSGSGSWLRIGDLPIAVVPMTVTSGTANAIVATAPETPQLPGRKLFVLTPTANNSGATTLAYNGQAALPIKSAFGNALIGGELLNASPIMMLGASDHFTLLLSTNVDASGILASAVAAQNAAASSATAAAGNAALLGNQVAQYDTRAAAIAAAIPAGVNFARTMAYDSSFTSNSGALFKRVAAGTPFTDTWPLTVTITGGSGYTNGTYYGMLFSGSATGAGLVATVTISGGALTAVDFSTQPGNAYKVGDVLVFVGLGSGGTVGAGTGASITIATISSPLASFVNTSDSSRWQYLVTKGAPHVNEFGAKADYISTDTGVTNNFAAIQAAMFYGACNLTGTSQDSSGYQGHIVKCGQGSYMLQQPSNSSMLVIPNGIYLEGVFGTTLKFHDAWYAATHCIAIGNPNAHFANFNCGMRYLTVFFRRGISAAVGTFTVYSNNVQDHGGVEHCTIYSGQRGGIKYEIGYGGASCVKFRDLAIACEGVDAAFDCNVGTTVVDCQNWSLSAPSSGTNNTQNAVSLHGTGGMYAFRGIHMEGFPNGFIIDLRTGNNPMASFKNITGGLNLAWVFTITGTSQSHRFSFEQCQMNNGLATGLINNGLSGGVSRTTDISPYDGIVGA